MITCKLLFKKAGFKFTVERKASFGSGKNIEIGLNSGLGRKCSLPSSLIIGNDVMMGPDVIILGQNHNFSNTDEPMRLQGYIKHSKNTLIIEDDVWIGQRAIITASVKKIGKGSIIGAGAGACCGGIGVALISIFGAVGGVATSVLTNFEIPLRAASIVILVFTYFMIVRDLNKECKVQFDKFRD